MAKSCLPIFPLVVFGIVEPALLLWGYIVALRNPRAFYAAQASHAPLPAYPASPTTSPSGDVPPQSLVLLLQLANVYALLAALGVACTWTPHASVARRFLLALALADYGHVWAAYRGVGAQVFWTPALWNDVLWGGVAGSAVLNGLRWLTLLGAFGAVGDVGDGAAVGVGAKRE
ncbi:hypothetical protein GGR54DRAFT_648260 [Hypoxylon sp. NC1633]|nr:hypothetical protein GGR54DRAFT_648260 [Hypoxylon sp. NC1633]